VDSREAPAERPPRLQIGRLVGLSDGVFAIAITLLVLEISVPTGSDDDLLRAILDQWPSYLAYVVSFSTIGVVWLAHSAVTEYLGSADAMVIRLNLLLLLVVSFLPFPTRLLAEYLGEDDPSRVAATVYGATLWLIAILAWVLWRYAVGAGLLREDVSGATVERVTKRLTPALPFYLGLIVVGLFLPVVAVLGYLVVALVLLVPFGLVRRRAAGA
jgi:uncharacterized membrane protein